MSPASVMDAIAWVLLALGVELFRTDDSPIVSLWLLLCASAFVARCIFLLRPPLIRRIFPQPCPEEESVTETYETLKADFSDQVLIRSIVTRPDCGAGLAGTRLRVGGWVKTGRVQGKNTLAFLEVSDGSCPANLQVIVDVDVREDLKQLVHSGTSVHVEGVLQLPPQGKKQQKVELLVEKVIHVGLADPAMYPIKKTKLTLELLRYYLHLRPRTNKISSVIRIRDELASATQSFFGERGFRCVHTPILTTSDCEGAGEMFQVTTLINEAQKTETDIKAADLLKTKENASKAGIPQKDGKIDYSQDFFGRPAFLTVSGQLQAETHACAVSRVYTFGPAFRAEKSHTSRHLAEFWMVEPEIAFADLQDDMDCAEAYVKYMCKWLLEKCLDDMEFMAEHCDKTCIDRLQMVSSTPFVRITYTEAVELLQQAVDVDKKKFERSVKWGIDLAFEHERYLTDVKFQKPVIVYNYPKDIKAFYMRLNDDKKTVAAMDLLVPKVGELIGGSQREERYEIMKDRILESELPLDPYEWYLDLRLYGTVKHSGFGLGFERMILFATGLDNIRDVIPFPRTPGRADR